MNILQAINERHSVRSYENRQIEESSVSILREHIDRYNAESGLHIQLILNEPHAFDSFMAHYGKFSGVTNYIALIGKKSADLDEKLGYYGEKLVLLAQTLGLNTCWVAMTYKKIKTAFQIGKGEKLRIVIALGYGKTNGVPHKNKPLEKVCSAEGEMPGWFTEGIRAALLAPTAMNQQKFLFTLKNNTVTAKAGKGFYTKIDLGIAKCHFEEGAGKENFTWNN